MNIQKSAQNRLFIYIKTILNKTYTYFNVMIT